jgi:hypothetical protein
MLLVDRSMHVHASIDRSNHPMLVVIEPSIESRKQRQRMGKLPDGQPRMSRAKKAFGYSPILA